MIVCQRCNTENLDGSQYCDECGALLSARSPATSARTTFIGQRASDLSAKNGDDMDAGTERAVAEDDGEAQGDAPAFAASIAGKAAVSGKTNDIEARLIIQRGRSAGKEFPLDDDDVQIGRWDADGGIFPDIDLDSDDPEAKVSRRHARIVRRNNQYFIEDLGSTNGTFVNRGRRLLPGDLQPLRDGDEIIVGKTFLRLRIMR